MNSEAKKHAEELNQALGQMVDAVNQRQISRREFMRLGTALGISATALTGLLAACGAQPTTAPAEPTAAQPVTQPTTAPTAPPAAATPPDMIVGAFGLDIDDLDPQYFKSIPGYQTEGNLYELLMNYTYEETDVGGLSPVADEKGNWLWQKGLAESTTFSDDRKTITIKLNKDAKFESGNPVTVDDWLFTFNRALVGEGYAKILMGMLTIESMDQVQALDDSTLQLSLKKPNPFAEKLLNINVIVPMEKAVVEPKQTADDPTAHAWLKANATACGPYKLKSWTPGTGWELEPNPQYWDPGSVKNKGVVYKVIPDAQTRLNLLKKGDIDIAHDIAPKDLADLAQDPNIKLFDNDVPWPFYLGLNTQIPPFDKKEVRQAVAYGTPYKTIIEKVLYNFADDLKSPIAKGMPGSDDSFWKYDTDLDKAKALLEQAGVQNLSFEIGLLLGRTEDEQTAVWIQSSLAQIGVEVKINKMTDAQFYELYNSHQLQAFITEWLSWVNDPVYHVYWHFLSTNVYTNATQYVNPEVDELILNALYEPDEAKRMELVKEIQRIVVDDCPWVFLYRKHWTTAARKNVMHYPWSPDTVGRFKWAYKS